MSNPGRDSPLPRRTPCVHAAAIDVGSEMHVAAVGADAAAQPVQRFGPYTSELQRLSDWLRGCHVTSVVLEATGSYWIPVYDHLEKTGFEMVLIDPHSL